MGGMPTADDLMSTAEVARLIGKSHRTVHRLVIAGKLRPAVVAPGGPAGVYMFDRADVARFISQAGAA